VDGETGNNGGTEFVVRDTGDGMIFSRTGQHVEVAHHDIRFRHRRLRKAHLGNASYAPAFHRICVKTLHQVGDLAQALVGTAMVEMDRVEPRWSEWRIDQRFEGAAL